CTCRRGRDPGRSPGRVPRRRGCRRATDRATSPPAWWGRSRSFPCGRWSGSRARPAVTGVLWSRRCWPWRRLFTTHPPRDTRRRVADELEKLVRTMFQAHPWHGVAAGDPAGVIEVYIEIVATDAVKYELDKQ